MRSITSIIILVVLCISTTGLAQIPQTISYQGVLTDGAGTPVADGDYDLTFKLYVAAGGGTEIWTETQSVSVSGGIFAAILGFVTPLYVAFDQPYWLGVSVDGGAELSPRRELTASPYSLNSQGVADSAITGGKIKNGTAVRSLNALTDDVTLAAGDNVTITQSNDSLIVSAGGGPMTDGDWTISGDDMYSAVSGNVGIGTASPEEKLHVSGKMRLDMGSSSGDGLVITATQAGGSVRLNGPAQDWKMATHPLKGSLLFVKVSGATFTPFTIKNTSFHDALVLDEKGVGIGTTAPEDLLHVAGGAIVDDTLVTSGFRLDTSPGAGYVLTSDATGTGTWQPASGASGWSLTGNAGTTTGSNFLGTTDDQPVEIWSNNERALRLEYHVDGPNVIGGHLENRVNAGVAGATIAGGGSGTFDRTTDVRGTAQLNNQNVVTDNYGFIGGGLANQAGDAAGTTGDSWCATVGGGQVNTASATWSSVVGGQSNEAAGDYSFVGGGRNNLASGEKSAVAGGYSNSAEAENAFVGGGVTNDATGYAATVAGGQTNVAGGVHATIGGGLHHTASGVYATVPGGYWNRASGKCSFAAGRYASAGHDYTFVWADSAGQSLSSSSGPNQFLIRASGGVGIGTNAPAAQLDVNGTARMKGFQLTLGYAAGYVLTSDDAGVGTWQSPTAFKSTAVSTSSGTRLMHAEESAEVWFTDYGFGTLRGGSARISLDHTFRETVDLDERYHVFIQAYGDADLYVTNRTPGGFEVRVRDGGPDVEFSYRVVAKRRGFERERMPLAARTH